MQSVGIIGAGQMGNGIAHVFAMAGFDVLLNDIAPDALDAAVSRIQANTSRQVSKGQMSEPARQATLARIRTTTQLGEIGGTDLVIEAATEREAVKDRIFAGLTASLEPETLLTSNTSSLSITRLAAKTDRLDIDCDSAVVTRGVDGGMQTIKVNILSIITVDLRLNDSHMRAYQTS